MQLWPKPHEIAKEAETLSFVTLSAWIRAVWTMILVEWVCWVLPIRTNYHTKYPSVGHLWSLLNIETKRIWSISTWWQFRLLCAYLFQHSSVLFLVFPIFWVPTIIINVSQVSLRSGSWWHMAELKPEYKSKKDKRKVNPPSLDDIDVLQRYWVIVILLFETQAIAQKHNQAPSSRNIYYSAALLRQQKLQSTASI